jgi:two-component system, chemotaxis family, chemotaxis protein CheY
MLEETMQALVIDDARAMRLILKHFLRQIGFAVSEACDGRAGLELLARMDRPDVVFVDCFMPEMDGFEFVRAVRADARYDGLRVLMASAQEEPAEQTRALEVGADAFVVKPFTQATIQATLEQLGLAAGSAV